MEWFWLLVAGLGTGVFGGMLGVGGSVVMIPAMTLLYGENQHLYQAAAMICNFFVSAAAIIAHRKAEVFNPNVLKWMIPTAMLGTIGGVALSNIRLFQGHNSYMLARVFGAFLIYVCIYNARRLYRSIFCNDTLAASDYAAEKVPLYAAPSGVLTGLAAGLLGIGAGTVATPLQQLTLKLPLRNAMSNSAAIIVSISWLGAIYKNATLAQHGIMVKESLYLAALLMPGSIIGGYLGGRLMHILPRNIIRSLFIALCVLAAIKLLTVH
ncbi:MAG: sulfite exporter TauE/SafE family protein [Planctomycetaceae bacterium]|nr:sulfite exporter TauE/SafE family protein [Planctomycetaceae bacterium]